MKFNSLPFLFRQTGDRSETDISDGTANPGLQQRRPPQPLPAMVSIILTLSPVGGQGMNSGIGDAVNLAWKLA
jgi:FAD binding domain